MPTLIAIQLLTVGQAWLAMPKVQVFKQQAPDPASLFVFSESRNVILVVLDTFQSDIFQDVVKDHPGLARAFAGFTYFRNALAGSDATSVSIPNMLTAANYDNSMPYLDFVRGAFLENSVPKVLRQYDFSVDLYPILPYSVYDDFSGQAMAARRLIDGAAFIREQAFLADLALFRDMPHFVKSLVYNRQRWLISGLVGRIQDAAREVRAGPSASEFTYAREIANSAAAVTRNRDASFINRMLAGSRTRPGPGAFKLYHLNGMHLQLVLNEDLEYGFMEPTREAMIRQGIGELKIAATFLERLKRLGVYDNSLVFIVGDHGYGLTTASVNPTPAGALLNRTGPYRGLFRSFKSAGIPLILAKGMGDHGPLRTSDAPVTLGDIPETVVRELGLRAEFPGESLFEAREGEERERVYRAFVGPQEGVDFMAPLYEYAVNGFSWDDASWRETGKVYYAREPARGAAGTSELDPLEVVQ
jgi:hypothetical protein